MFSINYLSWKKRSILSETLDSHGKNGLFQQITNENRNIFFQEISNEDIEIAKQYNIICLSIHVTTVAVIIVATVIVLGRG